MGIIFKRNLRISTLKMEFPNFSDLLGQQSDPQKAQSEPKTVEEPESQAP